MNYYVPQESAPIGGIEKLDSMANDVREPRACFLREVGVDVHYVRHVPGCANRCGGETDSDSFWLGAAWAR